MKVLLGVTGGVAAYKAAELTRLLQTRGADVTVAMTRAATRFVTPLTFAALTGKPVHTSLWHPSGTLADSPNSDFSIEHIAQATAPDVLLVAPATARTLARFAHGLADDFLSTLYLATAAPVVLAPAMNVNMWHHPATRANVDLLRARGNTVVEPDSGYLACGMTGSGRLASLDTIADAAFAATRKSQSLPGETILITAGGTHEPIDPVRFLGNRSSGRMGYALAEEAVARGARVLLITAASLPNPGGCEVLRATTAAAMHAAVLARLPEATVVIKAAAVADFRARHPHADKLRRNGLLTLELEPTEDIVADVVRHRCPGTLVLAFAAETEALEANARAKLLRKGVDAIIANDVSQGHIGFESDNNAGLFLTRERTLELPLSSKRTIARLILDQLPTLRQEHPADHSSTAGNLTNVSEAASSSSQS